jgi:hypothetical protein
MTLENLAQRIARDCTDEYGEIYPDQLAHCLRQVSMWSSIGAWMLGAFTGGCAVAIAWIVS